MPPRKDMARSRRERQVDGSVAGQGQGDALPAADAQGGEALLRVATDHLVQQGHQHPAAGRADRVAKGDGAAVDVDPGGIPAQFPTHRQGLRGEGLVGLDQVQLLQAPAGLVERATGGGDRADAHDPWGDAGAGHAQLA